MKVKGVLVPNAAIELTKKLIKDGKKNNPNFIRSEAFMAVDKKYGFPPHTIAQCFGKMESKISKNRQDLRKKYGGRILRIPGKKFKERWPHWKKSMSEVNQKT